MTTCCNLKPGTNKLSEAEIIGDRKNYEVTLFPSTMKAGELLTVRLPQLRKDVCLVPNSVNIAFEFKVTGTKAICMNNLPKALVKGFSVKCGNKDLYNNTDESTFSLFRDLWKSNDERQRLRANRIMTESMRKKISGDDTYQTSWANEGLFKIFGSTIRIQLGQIPENCGLFAPCAVREEFEFEMRLASNDEIWIAQPAKKGEAANAIGTYQLEDLRLEYEVIENKTLADEIVELYGGYHALTFKDVMSYRTETWQAGDTIRNIHVNPSRQSLKAIVCLFRTDDDNTENFEYPNIERVKITADGVAGAIYNHGIPKDKLFLEAKRLFGDRGVTESTFYLGSQFRLVIDLRTTSDKNLFGNEKEMSKKKESQISIEVKKKPTESNVTCHVFVVSDGVAKFEGADLEGIFV